MVLNFFLSLLVSHHQCKKKHTLVCPDFSKTGSCPRGARCKLQHRQRAKRTSNTSTTTTAKRPRTKESSKRSRTSNQQESVIWIHCVELNAMFNVFFFFLLLGPNFLSSSRRTLRLLQGRPPKVLLHCHPSSPSPALLRRQTHRTHGWLRLHGLKVWNYATQQT